MADQWELCLPTLSCDDRDRKVKKLAQKISELVTSYCCPQDFFNVVVGDSVFEVDKEILSLRSDYFKRLFERNYYETVSGYITLHDEDPVVIDLLLSYMQTVDVQFYLPDQGDRPANTFLLVEFWLAADRYQVASLPAVIEDNLKCCWGLYWNDEWRLWSAADILSIVDHVYANTTAGSTLRWAVTIGVLFKCGPEATLLMNRDVWFKDELRRRPEIWGGEAAEVIESAAEEIERIEKKRAKRAKLEEARREMCLDGEEADEEMCLDYVDAVGYDE